MKHNYFLSTLLMLLLFAVPTTWAGDDVNNFCAYELTSGSSHPLMTWETNFVGDIIITLNDGSGATNTVFRAGGMSDGVSTFYIVPADNHNANTEAKNYFYQEMIGNQFILHRKSRSAADETFLSGKHIKFYDKAVQWWCSENTNAAHTVNCFFPYDKSVICGATLDRPSITNIAADGTVSFADVSGATSYTARVYHDMDFLYEQTIVSGGKITYNPYIPEATNYEVTIQAFGDDDTKSRESEAAIWTSTGNLANLPMSKYCGDFVFQMVGNDNSRARLKIETKRGNEVGIKDTLVFTIAKYNESEASNPYWRSNGLNQNGLLYDGNPFTNYFQLVSNPASTQEIRYVPKDNPSGPITYGKKITYNLGVSVQNAEWATAGNNNAAANTWIIDYLYGTDCTEPAEPVEPEPEHSQPTDVSVDGSKVISFTAVPAEEAVDSYNAVVKLSGVTVKTVENIVSGETAIAYASTSATTYQVYVQAIKGGELYSTSEAYDWALPKEMSAPSEYCGYDVTCDSHTIKLTSETNFVGDVIIRIADGANSTNAVFRGSNGMGALNSYNVKSNGGATTEAASIYFTREYIGEGSREYILRRKANATLPADAKITFNGSVEWKSDENSSLWKSIEYNYTYGSSCANLPIPVISGIDETNHISFAGVAGATHYTLYVYNGKQLMHTQNVSTGDQITYLPYIEAATDYTVTVQAFDNDGGYSDESNGYTWNQTGNLANLPESNVCDYLIHQDGVVASYAYLSIETDDSDGSFYITIAPDNAAFRSNFVNNAGLKYDGTAITEYFDRTTEDVYSGSYYKTLKYTPKNREDVQYGKNITFNMDGESAQIEWRVANTDKNTPNMSFSYIYGTACSLSSLRAHGNTSEIKLHANHPDDNLTVDDAMTINGNGHKIGDITVTTAGALTVGSALTANKLLVNAKPGASGQVISAANLTVSEAWMSQQLLPDAEELNPATDWYCFTVPFAVSLTDGVYTNEGVKLNSGSDYLIWRYDGEQRAATGKGWVKATENLSAGVAYLIGFKNNETAKTFRFKKADGALTEPSAITITAHASGNAANANWNAVGNPSLRHIDVTDNKTVQVLNNASQTFAPYQTNEQSFVVGSPFFVQATDNLTLAAASHPLLAPARTPAQRMQACVEIYKEGRSWPDDRLYVAADETASDTWEQGRDVPTLNTTSNRVALMHTPYYGMKLAAVELPWAEQVDYSLVLTAPANGSYRMHAASVTEDVMVLLTKDGIPVWDLSAEDCALDLTGGTDTSYGLRLVQMAPQMPTDVTNIRTDSRCHKMMRNGQLYILRDGHWYNAVGQSVLSK